MGLSTGLLTIWHAAVTRVRDQRERERNKNTWAEASVVLSSNLGSDISSLLPYLIGYTDQPWYKWGENYIRV